VSSTEFRSASRLAPVAIAVLAVCSMSAPARAQVSLGAKSVYSVGAGSPTTQQVNTSPSDIFPSLSDPSGDSIFGHVYSYDTGAFGSRSSGNNTFNITGTATYSDIFTATVAGDYVFHYEITAGDLKVNLLSGANGTQTGSLSAVITEALGTAPATTLLDYQAAMGLTNSAAVATFSESGLVLNASGAGLGVGNGTYAWNAYDSAVDLGSLAAGQQVTVNYTLISTATGTTVGTAPCAALTGVGVACVAAIEPAIIACPLVASPCLIGVSGSAEARVGDPVTTIPPSTPQQFGVSLVTVPEPGTFGVLGAGLLALTFTRRNRTPA
jgi:hypothetical protein